MVKTLFLHSSKLRKYNEVVRNSYYCPMKLAHYHLGHYLSYPEGLEGLKFENEADELAKSWSF